MKCTCRLYINSFGGPGVEYCPLHSAAPEMLNMLDQAGQLFAYFAKTHGYETCAGMAHRIGGLLAELEAKA